MQIENILYHLSAEFVFIIFCSSVLLHEHSNVVCAYRFGCCWCLFCLFMNSRLKYRNGNVFISIWFWVTHLQIYLLYISSTVKLIIEMCKSLSFENLFNQKLGQIQPSSFYPYIYINNLLTYVIIYVLFLNRRKPIIHSALSKDVI